jgi:putative ABC transport system ATP-binding protein
VAIARALARKPKLVIADEPTANLDSRTTASILDLIRHIQRSHGISFLVASHDERVMREADVTIHLLDGHIQQIEQTPRSTGRSSSSRSRSQRPSPSPGVGP